MKKITQKLLLLLVILIGLAMILPFLKCEEEKNYLSIIGEFDTYVSVDTVFYEKVFGLPSLDSSSPVTNGFMISYFFKYDSVSFKKEIFYPNSIENRNLIREIDSKSFKKIKVLFKSLYPDDSKLEVVNNR